MSTIRKQQQIAKEVKAALELAAGINVDGLKAIDVLDIAMKTYMRAGSLAEAVAVAEKLAPYQSSKQATSTAIEPLPEDLLPQPTPTPDDPDVPPLIE